MGMTKAEQEWSLIEALEYCKKQRPSNKSCAGCPYAGLGCGIDAAIEKLKAQEPKVMHVDEIQEFSTVWLEDVDKPEIIPAIYLEQLCGRLGFIQPGRGMIYPKADECGKRWRPWTSRPTDAQKEAVKWE